MTDLLSIILSKMMMPRPQVKTILGLGLVMLCVACGRTHKAPVTRYGQELAQGISYASVRAGDTLFSIAERYNLPLRGIIDLNEFKPPYPLKRGQRIKLPPPNNYYVRHGDSLYSISRLFGVDAASLARLNNLKPPYNIHAGQKIRIPSSGLEPKRQPVTAPPSYPLAKAVPVQKPAQGSQSTPGKKPVTAATPPRAGDGFMWPVNGTIVSSYGRKAGGLHNDGINIGAPRGTPVRAAENGTVVYIGDELRSFGNLALVRHADGWVSAYGHMDKFLVKRGETVRRGQSIGVVGSSGTVDSPQLHFELRKGSKALDPQKYLN